MAFDAGKLYVLVMRIILACLCIYIIFIYGLVSYLGLCISVMLEKKSKCIVQVIHQMAKYSIDLKTTVDILCVADDLTVE